MLSRTPGHWSLWFSRCGWSARRKDDSHRSACGPHPGRMASDPDLSPFKGNIDKTKCCVTSGHGRLKWAEKLRKYCKLQFPQPVVMSREGRDTTWFKTWHLWHMRCIIYFAVALWMWARLAGTRSHLKVALYSAGRKVFTRSVQEQRTCVWLGTWQETFSFPGGSGRRESDSLLSVERKYSFYKVLLLNVIFEMCLRLFLRSSLLWTKNISGVPWKKSPFSVKGSPLKGAASCSRQLQEVEGFCPCVGRFPLSSADLIMAA